MINRINDIRLNSRHLTLVSGDPRQNVASPDKVFIYFNRFATIEIFCFKAIFSKYWKSLIARIYKTYWNIANIEIATILKWTIIEYYFNHFAKYWKSCFKAIFKQYFRIRDISIFQYFEILKCISIFHLFRNIEIFIQYCNMFNIP